MILSDGKPRCDAEIGKPNRWRTCNAPAAIETWHSTASGNRIRLDYCKRHAKRAKGPIREHKRS
jgi:hypothetical protein